MRRENAFYQTKPSGRKRLVTCCRGGTYIRGGVTVPADPGPRASPLGERGIADGGSRPRPLGGCSTANSYQLTAAISSGAPFMRGMGGTEPTRGGRRAARKHVFPNEAIWPRTARTTPCRGGSYGRWPVVGLRGCGRIVLPGSGPGAPFMRSTGGGSGNATAPPAPAITGRGLSGACESLVLIHRPPKRAA